MFNHKAMISAGLCAVSLMASSPAFAEARSVAVTISDLDLSGPSGQAQLERRVARAARAVCSSDTRGAKDVAAAKKCEAQAIIAAEPKIANRIAQQQSKRGIAIRADLKLASD